MRVGELTEAGLLARIIPRLPTGTTTLIGPGDDAAVLAPADAPMVVTTDILVQDRHFRLDWGTGADVGWRAAMQNLADVAAMGAVPTSIVVALVLPAQTEVAWVEGLADGLAQACAPHQVGVVGGDLTGGDQIVIAVTAHGVMDDGEPVLRSGARAGDVVALSGTLGRSAAGAALLGAGRSEPAELISTFLRPAPPLADGPVALRAGAHALMDVSDGLAIDAGRMAQASGVVIDLDPAALAADIEALKGAATMLDADARAWALGGGEDHGLLATFPASGAVAGPDASDAGDVTSGRPAGPGTPGPTTFAGADGGESAASSSGLPGQYRPIGRVRSVPPGGQPGVRWGGTDLPAGAGGWDHFGG